ncbi:Peptide chain release factor 2 [Candidatus Arsenophonus lipoptenae]|uniref:Peptide chain release factor 2 n=1 Tax=Candidatus Arsenophonus lipoptenae TaxID=634113 RepID=A0A120HPT0_9GAMM|nr:peptide chain release factor 2 [Candidatus Arsenophonus lipoptenae]AMA64695.1 Peptide chain release factor 2 [Candidatus Arsenophonus lipoptenae]
MFDINQMKNHIQDLFKRVKILINIFCYDTKKKHLEKIKIELEYSDLWRNPKRALLLSKESVSLEEKIKTIDVLLHSLYDANDLLDLIIEEYDEEIYCEIKTKLLCLEKKVIQLELQHMFSVENAIANCYIDLQAGSGGTEAQDWASMLMRMYLRWAESKCFRTEIIDIADGDIAGLKSATIKIIGEYAYGWLHAETGIHRLVRKSPFDSGGRRHTSFSSAFIYPEVNDDIEIELNPSDLRIDVYRASGAGGQHINKTESAVRITHIPTGIVSKCQNDRSQHKNKVQALKQIKAKLYELEIQKKNTDKQILEENKSNICWGNQIRSYILDDSRIKDLRTGVENRNPKAVLDGDLDIFIEASLRAGL